MMQEAANQSEGRVRFQAGSLYRLLARMLADRLVAESQRRPAADADDERRRYYRITPLGRRVIAAEAERMASLVAATRATLGSKPYSSESITALKGGLKRFFGRQSNEACGDAAFRMVPTYALERPG